MKHSLLRQSELNREVWERDELVKAIQRVGPTALALTRHLGIPRATLFRLLKKYRLYSIVRRTIWETRHLSIASFPGGHEA